MALLIVCVFGPLLLTSSSKCQYFPRFFYRGWLCNRRGEVSPLGLCFQWASWTLCQYRGWIYRNLLMWSQLVSHNNLQWYRMLPQLMGLYDKMSKYFNVWWTTPLNLFFLQVPLLRGSKSLKYYLYRIRLILDVFLIYSNTCSTFSGIRPRVPVPFLGMSLTTVM